MAEQRPLGYDDRVRFSTDEERDKWSGEKEKETAGKVAKGLAAQPFIYSNPITAGLAIVGGDKILKHFRNFKTGKPDDQIQRDSVRDFLAKNGYVGSDWKLQFSDGGSFDIGKDGNSKLPSLDGTERKYYETDSKNPLSGQAAAAVSPIAALITNNNDRLKSDFSGYFTNAATQDAKDPSQVKQRITDIYAQMGITKAAGLKSLADLKAQGRLSDEQFAQYSSIINQYAPEADTRSFVDAFLPRGSYANTIAARAVAKFQEHMGMDFSPNDNIHEFGLPERTYNDPQYVQAPQAPVITAKPNIIPPMK